MAILTETGVGPEFLLSEAPGNRSREQVTVAASQTLVPGTAVGQIDRGAQTVTPAAFSGNTGNGLIGTVTADTAMPAGRYTVLIIEPATNGGTFQVNKPDGTLDGRGTIAVAYNGSINFTLADGATDFVAGDGFNVDVSYAAGSDQIVIHDPEGTDGRETLYGFMYSSVVTGVGETAEAVAIVRDAEVIAARLTWDDHDAGEKAAALATAYENGIIAR